MRGIYSLIFLYGSYVSLAIEHLYHGENTILHVFGGLIAVLFVWVHLESCAVRRMALLIKHELNQVNANFHEIAGLTGCSMGPPRDLEEEAKR
jgi:hypothetical protein